MNRFILLAFAVHFSPTAIAIADDYLLRLDTIAYVDKSAAEQDPKETILRSIEVVARPKSAFHGRADVGEQTLTLAGELRPADNGGFNVLIRYIYSMDKGTTVPTEDGKRKPLPSTTKVETNVTIAVGDSVIVGGLETKTSRSGMPEHKSKIRYVLVLSKYEPTVD